MTWDQMIERIREGLTESGAYLQVVAGSLEKEEGNTHDFSMEGVVDTLTCLTLAMSELLCVVSSLSIGLDAVVEILCEDDEPTGFGYIYEGGEE